MSLVLIDTNVLVYLFDFNEPLKQPKAQLALDRLEFSRNGRLSVQNLAEFIHVVTRKLNPLLTISQAGDQAAIFTRLWPVFDLTPMIVLEAARGMRDHGLAYYDAQIWATARLNQVPVIFSENFQDKQMLEGVRFVNPFAANFVLDEWA